MTENKYIMSRIPARWIALFMLFFFSGLINGQKSEDRYNRLFKDQVKVSGEIKGVLDGLEGNPDTRVGGDKIHNIEYITNLYQQAGFQPFWAKAEYVENAIRGIMQSYDDGLLPGDYHLDAILEMKEQLTSGGQVSADENPKAGELDVLLTDGVLLYAYHLLYGKADQSTLVPTWNFEYAPIPDLNHKSFRESIEALEIPARLAELRPDMFLYVTLVATLARYRQFQSAGGWVSIQPGGKIEPGDTDERIPQVRHRLHLTGELTEPDSIRSKVYDIALENDVKKFQSLHGLDSDGIIGAGTFRELGKPVEDRIEAIRVNLERIRWVANGIPQNYLIVNIAAFTLILVKEGSEIHTARVVVGKTLNKTPIFKDKLRYIEFNPTWTVPTSIKNKEVIHHLKKDSTYLDKNHMVLLDSKGNEVSIKDVDLKKIAPGNFPYMVRQQPGPWNSLGVVKFMFPNEYDIYLHDTPSKSLFSKASRAYSHGCIRVDKPLDLAEVLLEGTEWNRNKIDKTIETRETTRVIVDPRLDVLLMYWTCGLTSSREIFFVPDIYERDKDVLRELDRSLH
jgi:murein L,D-transpeptidase YcbB/YkuD